MQKLRTYWEATRASYWFVPMVMTVVAIFVAPLFIRLDEAIQQHESLKTPWSYTGSAEGARQLLATVAGSMVTVAGVVFSVTVVALSMASSQFGPRLLRNFMSDRGNQVVLGAFIATFVYCLLVLRAVRGQNGGFVPQISVTVAVVLSLAAVGVLIYFIHHVAQSMQAPQVIANVSAELRRSIDDLFPEQLGQETAESDLHIGTSGLPPFFERDAWAVAAREDGYIQLVDDKALMDVAVEKDLLLRIRHRPGQFVTEGGALAHVWPIPHDHDLEKKISSLFVLGPQQTPTQDAGFAINQLVEVAVRALSPGINDPFTAMACLDRLGAGLCRLAGRKLPSPYRQDEKGRVRIVARPLTFANAADAALSQIRHYGRTNSAVLLRILDIIALVLDTVRRDEDRQTLLRHALHVKEVSGELPLAVEREEVANSYESVLQVSRFRATGASIS